MSLPNNMTIRPETYVEHSQHDLSTSYLPWLVIQAGFEPTTFPWEDDSLLQFVENQTCM